MNFSMIKYVLASILCAEGLFFLLPAVVALIYGEDVGWVYLGLALATFAVGMLGRLRKPKSTSFFAKDGFVAVSLGWILISLVGAIPFTITKEIPFYINSLFETISGFTTTGSSIVNDLTVFTHASLFWRSFTHWVGGMGVLVFIMAVLPLSGSSSMHMMRAESPGPTVGKLVPKAKNTAKILYEIYVAITIIEIIALLIAGLDWFEASTLTFGTVGTGGFGLVSTSIGGYNVAVQVIITIFMIVCSINFSIYYLLLIRKPKLVLINEELRWYLIMVFGAGILITVNIADKFDSIPHAFQTSMFQVASIASSTGYATADFNAWPAVSKSILLIIMMIGACAGSTGGGFKMSRVVIILKSVKNDLFAITHPRVVTKVKVNQKTVTAEVVKKTTAYLGAYVAIFIVSFLIISIDGKSIETNISAVAATFNNIGPGMDAVGPTASFSCYGAISKFVLMFDMIAGRLEIFPLIVLFTTMFSGTKIKYKRAVKNSQEIEQDDY